MPRLEPLLLAAVTAAPGDDAPRLRCARALRERGDPWAELIEIQCEQARLGVRGPEELRQREAAWLAEHGAQLEEDLGVAACTLRFERGFVARLFVGDADQARQVCEGLARHPVESVSLFGPEVAASHNVDALRTTQALAAWLSTTCL